MSDQDTRKSQNHQGQQLDDPNHQTVNQQQPPDQPSHMNQGKWPSTPKPDDGPEKKTA